MDETFLSWFHTIVTRNLMISRGVILILDVNPKWYEVSKHIATKFKVNPWIISILKKKKTQLKHEPTREF